MLHSFPLFPSSKPLFRRHRPLIVTQFRALVSRAWLAVSVVLVLLASCSESSGDTAGQLLATAVEFADSCTASQSNKELAAWRDSLHAVNDGTHSATDVYNAISGYGYELLAAGRQVDAVLYNRSLLDVFGDGRDPSHDAEQDAFRGRLYVRLGASLEEIGLKNSALSTYNEGLDFTSAAGLPYQHAMLLNNLGVIYSNLNNCDEALDYFTRALSLNLAQNPQKYDEICINYWNISDELEREGNLNAALDSLLKALPYISSDEQTRLYMHHVRLGQLYRKLGNTRLSIDYLSLATTRLDSLGMVPGLMEALSAQADAWRQAGILDSALVVNRRALDIAREVGNPRSQYTLLDQRAHIEADAGNLDRAFALMDEGAALRDSVANVDAFDKMDQLQALFRTQPRTTIIDRWHQRDIFLAMGLLVLALSLATVLVWLSRRRMEERLSRASEKIEVNSSMLEASRREMSVFLMERAKHNEELESVMEELRPLLQQLSPRSRDTKAHISRLLKRLDKISDPTDWDELQAWLENSDPKFIRSLEARFPSLTTRDKRFCLLLRLMLSNKEIASLTGLEVRSVETVRNRLRKKLGLERDVNLVDFLRSIG